MKRILFLILTSLLLAGMAALADQTPWTPDQQEVLAAIGQLSATTAPDGGGADAYGALLADGFTRWTVGSELINDKGSWVAGIREWFDDGWRVADRVSKNLEIRVNGEFAFTRRIVQETYLGPDGDRSEARAAVAEVWIRGDERWLLLRANVHPLDHP